MKRILLGLAALHLSGCVAAVPVVMGAASIGWVGYNVYNMGTISKGKYDIDKSEPSSEALAQIKAARTVAVFPTDSPIDGDVVDIFNERSDLTTVSSRKTIAAIERSGVDQSKILSYPARDRAMEISSFGKAVGSDLVVFATYAGADVTMNPLLARARSNVDINCKLYSTKTGELLLDENHTLTYDARDTPTNNDIAKVVAMGVSDRLYELRTGEKRDGKAKA